MYPRYETKDLEVIKVDLMIGKWWSHPLQHLRLYASRYNP